ncbi:hypothetical protein LDL08_16760 [Nonomuraea glycinis]|uniref:hypothetical protein n=1 Tax=Nonomuraea glycinis TaxID=2047744 RepID=UPI001665CA8A|nr:hypothetical protein [Nonomuraea glycinis]MCA2177843.1 hypothetical protein [Nonomuraea glycinis]
MDAGSHPHAGGPAVGQGERAGQVGDERAGSDFAVRGDRGRPGVGGYFGDRDVDRLGDVEADAETPVVAVLGGLSADPGRQLLGGFGAVDAEDDSLAVAGRELRDGLREYGEVVVSGNVMISLLP